ncbi:MAG TPA: radical SAM family heme chaperone HemW [Saprospiraceae bacterium]|nr:radical SAM family heme chaperone HemW [Saprospiraceae bacterium]HQW55839.1 radical SAM family heme chaperone HemW [Saprospiraceae bacterium]
MLFPDFSGGMYLHIPFCKQACHYCNFHFSTSLHYKDDLVDALCREISIKGRQFNAPKLKTIYLGGGTPSLLSAVDLQNIFNSIKTNFQVNAEAEITLEANPDDINTDWLDMLQATPINRLSIGLQSFYNEHLTWMNRAHNEAEALQAIELSQERGYHNLNVDLIFGFDSLSLTQLETELKIIVAKKIPHISTYNLTVEEQTMLHKKIKRGEIQTPTEQTGVTHFLFIHEFLTQHGYAHYEISNYALPGFESQHNTAYWHGKPYLGIGPSAHSYFAETRSWNVSNNQQYIRALKEGKIPQESESLDDRTRYNELVMTSLRTQAGLSTAEIELFGEDIYRHFITKTLLLIKDGKIIQTDDRFILSLEGMILSDHIFVELFY